MFEDSLFTVAKEPVYRVKNTLNTLTGETESSQILVPSQTFIVNQKTDQVLSVKSKDYEIISEAQILEKFLEKFAQESIQVRPIKHHVTKAKDGVFGRTTYMELELPQFSLFRDDWDEEQTMRLVIPNSYDGTLKAKFIIMFWRQLCRNGMMGWSAEFDFAFKHRKGAIERMNEAINLFLAEKVTSATSTISVLQNNHGQRDLIHAYLMNNKILSGERWTEKLMADWIKNNTNTNLWYLYNLFTNKITHEYGRNYGVKLVKFALLNKEVKTVWQNVLGVANNFTQEILLEG